MLYIYCGNLNEDGFVGIKKKVLAQCQVFRKTFNVVYYTIFAGQVMYLLEDNKVIDKEFAITKKSCYEVILKWLVKYDIQKTYIRYALSDMWFIEFLKEMRELGIKSVLEFPTIPYDNEGWIVRPIEDRYYREELYKYIDCCTTYANYKTVFNIPCVSLVNGVDINAHRIKKQNAKRTYSLVLLGVATMRREHGYERIIEGLHKYYESCTKRKIYFNLVGDGIQMQYYKGLVENYKLKDYVRFYGFLQGETLDKVYEDSDIGIGPLGMYKSGISTGVGIKGVEYCIKGLPMIMTNDYGFENKYYVLKVPNDDTPIDMNKVIGFYDSLQKKNYIKDMYNYIVENYSWDKILKPVIEYLRSN